MYGIFSWTSTALATLTYTNQIILLLGSVSANGTTPGGLRDHAHNSHQIQNSRRESEQRRAASIGPSMSLTNNFNRLKEISTPDFSTSSFNHERFNPGLFNHEFLNHGVEKFMVEKSGVEMSSL